MPSKLDGGSNAIAPTLARPQHHQDCHRWPTEHGRIEYGAAEAIAAELNLERTTTVDAVTALTDLIVGSLDTRTDR